MAEGRRTASEKRRQEAEAARAEKQRLEEEEAKLRIEPATIHDFERLRIQLKTFLEEIKVLSKKSPDGPVNKFKLRFLNDVLKKMTAILGDTHRPFPDFEMFDEDDLPTTSDVVLMLSHYADSMGRFFADHTYGDDDDTKLWYTKGDEDIEV